MPNTRPLVASLAAAMSIGWLGIAVAQPTQPAPQEGVVCPPDVKGNPPGLGRNNSGDLSDKLTDSKGVICPPAGVDPDMPVNPPGGGRLRVIPPPRHAR